MTLLSPAPTAPAELPLRRGHPARRLVLATLGALLLGALLNPADLEQRAKQQPYGWQRTATVRVAQLNATVSGALLLDRPRTALDRLLDRDGHDDGSVPGPTVGRVQPRTPTRAQPLRVYLGGDSVAQAFGEGLVRGADESGLIQPTVEFRLNTGLARTDYYDWPAHLRQVLSRSPRPEVVILLFGANDVQPLMTSSGVVRPGSSAWLTAYAVRVGAAMDLLTRAGVDVYWVGQPPMRSAELSARISEMDDVYAAEAARRTGVTFVDTRPMFASASGGYAAYLPDANGRRVLVRTPDGVHLTAAGADRLTSAVLRVVSRRWPLPE